MSYEEAASVLKEVQRALVSADPVQLTSAEVALQGLRHSCTAETLQSLARDLRVVRKAAVGTATRLQAECSRMTVDSFGYSASGDAAAPTSALCRGTHG